MRQRDVLYVVKDPTTPSVVLTLYHGGWLGLKEELKQRSWFSLSYDIIGTLGGPVRINIYYNSTLVYQYMHGYVFMHNL